MRKLIVKGLVGTMITGGMLVSGIGIATADSGADAGSVNSGTILSGNNVNLPINIPITACGNGVGLLNLVQGGCVTNGSDGQSAGASSFSINEASIGSGNNLNAPINIPITACGNAIGALNLVDGACIENNRKPVFVPTGCVHDCSPVAVPVYEPCRQNCRPVTIAEPCRKDCGPAFNGRPVVFEPGRARHNDRPVKTVPVATERSVIKESSGGIAHTGLTAVAAAPIGGLLLLGGLVFYRRSRVRTQG